jgi:ribosomal protein L29
MKQKLEVKEKEKLEKKLVEQKKEQENARMQTASQ